MSDEFTGRRPGRPVPSIYNIQGKHSSRRQHARDMFLRGAGIDEVMAATGLTKSTCNLYLHEARREHARRGEIVLRCPELPPDLRDALKVYLQEQCIPAFLMAHPVKSTP